MNFGRMRLGRMGTTELLRRSARFVRLKWLTAPEAPALLGSVVHRRPLSARASLTPIPFGPHSARNSTPACSRAAWSTLRIVALGSRSPSSKLAMVLADTQLASASSGCVQPRSDRAAPRTVLVRSASDLQENCNRPVFHQPAAVASPLQRAFSLRPIGTNEGRGTCSVMTEPTEVSRAAILESP